MNPQESRDSVATKRKTDITRKKPQSIKKPKNSKKEDFLFLEEFKITMCEFPSNKLLSFLDHNLSWIERIQDNSLERIPSQNFDTIVVTHYLFGRTLLDLLI